MTEERVQLLQRVGFQWSARDPPATTTIIGNSPQRPRPMAPAPRQPAHYAMAAAAAAAPYQHHQPEYAGNTGEYEEEGSEEEETPYYEEDEQAQYHQPQPPPDAMNMELERAEREAQEAAAEARRKAKQLEQLKKRHYNSGTQASQPRRKVPRQTYWA